MYCALYIYWILRSHAYKPRRVAPYFSATDMLLFTITDKAARHPFFKNVYAHAAKINKRFADNMDTCIVK